MCLYNLSPPNIKPGTVTTVYHNHRTGRKYNKGYNLIFLNNKNTIIQNIPPLRVRLFQCFTVHYFLEADGCLEECFLFLGQGRFLPALSSVLGPRGGGVEAKASVGATQPEVAAVHGFSASWRYSSRLTGSVGLASNGL